MAEPHRIGGAAAYVTVEELLRARLSAAIGGWRGALESAIPTIAFVVIWTVTQEVRPAVIAAGAALVVLAVLRLLRKETLRFLLYAAVAVAVAAFFALRSGRARTDGIITHRYSLDDYDKAIDAVANDRTVHKVDNVP